MKENDRIHSLRCGAHILYTLYFDTTLIHVIKFSSLKARQVGI